MESARLTMAAVMAQSVEEINQSRTPDDTFDAIVWAARLFATHVAVTLGHAQEEHHLNQALQSRKTIGQATGILMERFHVDEDRAFQFLLRASSTSNIKLRDVAAEVATFSAEGYRRKH